MFKSRGQHTDEMMKCPHTLKMKDKSITRRKMTLVFSNYLTHKSYYQM